MGLLIALFICKGYVACELSIIFCVPPSFLQNLKNKMLHLGYSVEMQWNGFLCIYSLRFGDICNSKWVGEGVQHMVGRNYTSNKQMRKSSYRAMSLGNVLFSSLIRT